jgi:hypothetical protein
MPRRFADPDSRNVDRGFRRTPSQTDPDMRSAPAGPPSRSRLRIGATLPDIEGDVTSGFTPSANCSEMKADRAVLTRKQEEMRHPSTVSVDPAYADEPLDRLRRDYIEYLKGRAQPTSPETVIKYNSSLLSFIRFLELQGEEQVLGSLTPGAVSSWVNAQRTSGRSEDGVASRLSAVKVFSSLDFRPYAVARRASCQEAVDLSATGGGNGGSEK